MDRLLPGAPSGADMMFGMPTPGLFENDCCSLSKKTRLYGFLACFSLGIVLSIISSFFLATLQITSFAVCYSFGNIISLFSTGFLVGPLQQLKQMFAKKRVLATLSYLGILVITLIVAFKTKSVAGTLVLVLSQCLALVWYTASYIPYGRTLITRALKACVA